MSGLELCCGAAASRLTSVIQVTCTAPHHAANRELRRSTPCKQFDHLVLLMANDTFLIEENCQHHFHLALNLVYFFCLASETLESSIVMTGLLFLGHTHRLKVHHQRLLSSANTWLLQDKSVSARLAAILGQISQRHISCPNQNGLYQTK